MKLSGDAVLGIASVVLASAYFAEASAIPQSLLADAVGADGVPRLLAFGLGATGLALAGRGIARPVASKDDAPPDAYRRAAGLLAILVAYLFVVPMAGYAISIAALIAAVAWYAGAKPDGTMVAAAIGGAALFWFMFGYLLGIPLPTGFF